MSVETGAGPASPSGTGAGTPGLGRRAGRRGRIARSSPYAQRGLTGWLRDSGGIDAAVEDGVLPDPLFGGYRIYPLDNVVVVHPGRGRTYRVASLTTKLLADQEGRYAMTPESVAEEGGPEDARGVAVACADFDADGKEEIAWLVHDAGALHLVIARAAPEITPVSITPLPYPSEGWPTLVSGVFYEPGGSDDALRPQLVVGWQDAQNTIHLELFTVGADLFPHHVSGVAADQPKHRVPQYALAAGDVDGSGLDVVALVCPRGGAGLELMARLFSVSAQGGFTAHPPAVLGPFFGPKISATFGDFDRDGREELAVVWSPVISCVRVRLAKATEDYGLTPRGQWDERCPDIREVAIASGPLAVSPGVDTPYDQIVAGFSHDERGVELRLLESDQGLNLGPKHLKASAVVGADAGYDMACIALELSCGSLAGGALNTVVVGCLGWSPNMERVRAGYVTLTVGSVPVAPDLSRFGVLDVRAAYVDEQAQVATAATNAPIALALGDLTGASVRVGKPKRYQAEDVKQILAVLNAPPAHQILRDGEDPVDVNFNGDAWLDFTNSRGQETEFRSELRKDWGYSKQVRAGIRTPIATVEASLSSRYGEHFEKVSGQIVTTRVSLDKDQLWAEDAVVVCTTAYTVWEYDVYDSGVAAPVGKLAVIFPSTRPPRLAVKGSKDILFDYCPAHTLGNALSYHTVDDLPDDVTDGGTMGSAVLAVGSSQSKLTVNWESTKEQVETRGSDQDISLGLDVGFNPLVKGWGFGINVSVEGSYGDSELTSATTRMTETTDLTVTYLPLPDLRWDYAVEPIVYWSKKWGYLVVDYLVTIPESKKYPTAWQEVYGDKCDLAFSLPWSDGSKGPDFLRLTRDIALELTPEGALKAEVVVRNQSLLAVGGVRVDLYDGPVEGEPLHTETLAQVGARGTATFSHTWPATPGTHTVWAVIDPENKQPDLYRGNDRGWSRIIV